MGYRNEVPLFCKNASGAGVQPKRRRLLPNPLPSPSLPPLLMSALVRRGEKIEGKTEQMYMSVMDLDNRFDSFEDSIRVLSQELSRCAERLQEVQKKSTSAMTE